MKLPKTIISIIILGGIAFAFGCAKDVKTAKTPVVSNISLVSDLTGKEKTAIRKKEKVGPEVYPEIMSPNAPLVLAIPGLVIPGEKITQEEHFGNLVELLTKQGFPCKVLAYDTKDNPLTSISDLVSERASIAATRIGPLIMREIERENLRRSELKMPRVKKVVFVSYSQGSVIIFEIEKNIVRYRREYADFVRRFGIEWERLLKDPEFKIVNEVLDDAIFLENIRVEHPEAFENDAYLEKVRERTLEKLHNKTRMLFDYLDDPSDEYPKIKKFASIESDKYPKRYDKLAAYARELMKNEDEAKKFDMFLVDFTRLRTLLEVEPRVISLAGSFFGSPRANTGYQMIKDNPFGGLVGGRIARQVEETRLGSEHQIKTVEILASLEKEGKYPINRDRSLFVLGMDGDKGDGYVDQSSAHLSGHTFTLIDTEKDIPEKLEKDEVLTFPATRLPEMNVVPLNVRHFPEGDIPGVAYLTEDNPVFDYLLAFIWEDNKWIEEQIAVSPYKVKQFMIQVTLQNPKPVKHVELNKIVQTDDIKLEEHFYNERSNTYVWTGHFVDGKKPEKTDEGWDKVLEAGEITFELKIEHKEPFKFAISVYPGSNSFAKVIVHNPQGEPVNQ
ncbi:MAG: hypothetical protein PHE61_00135 [Candidatus Omnitrophica bacterium]|nr:hypothetical protein [Candidatus Omnitrophota bacterium]